MEESARRYARKILLLHIVLLAVVVLLVFFAGKEIYESTRQQVLDQAMRRQALLANQTARGIESFYGGILNDLDLLQRSEAEQAATTQPSTQPANVLSGGPTVPAGGRNGLGGPNGLGGGTNSPGEGSGSSGGQLRPLRGFIFARPLWRQLESRVSHLFVYDKASRTPIVFDQHRSGAIATADIVQRMNPWLQSVQGKAISGFQLFGDEGINVVCMPADPEARRILAAVVPVREVERIFFEKINADPNLGITLVDDTQRAMATSNKKLVGANLLQAGDDAMRAWFIAEIAKGQPFTHVIEQALKIQDVALKPALLAFEPINLPNKRWWVYVALPIAEIDSTLDHVFNRALMWAAFVVISVTGILVSTSVQMIRGRVRLERIRHELLKQELEQARRIQLAWLPESNTVQSCIDIAAVNQPASHISGDFYNWFELPDGRMVVTIGDVTGHGMSAAFLMATTQLLVRTTMLRLGDPGRCLEDINNQLCQQVFNGQFVTMLILVIDPGAQTMDLAVGGHPSPLLFDGQSFQSLPVAPQLVLGVERDIDYPTERFSLAPGSQLVLYTDGVVDAQSPAGQRLHTAGLQALLTQPQPTAADLLQSIVAGITHFRGPRDLADDLTLVTVHLPPPSPSRPTA